MSSTKEKYKSADEVEDGPYLLKDVEAPVLSGFRLRMFLFMVESPLFPPIRNYLMWKNGYKAGLEGSEYPEKPTYEPSLPPFEVESLNSRLDDITKLDLPERVSRTFDLCSDNSSHTESPVSYPSVADYHKAYTSGRCTPRDVAEALIEAVRESESQDPQMRIFIAFNEDDVRSAAAASTTRFDQGAPLSVLDGVPFCVKDTINALPYATTEGTGWLADTYVVKEDSTLVARLRSLGALLMGKTNMHEIGIGTTGLNVVHGTPRNPHDVIRHTGGSSSGSAAAVASALCPIALGTDGGGSLRIPASYCGCVGLKPTHHRVSLKVGDKPSFHGTVAVFGPIAASVRDAAIMYAALANNGNEKSILPPLRLPRCPLPADNKPLQDVTIAVYWKWFEDADAEVVSSCKQGLAAMQEAGAELISANIPELHLLQLAHSTTIASEHLACILQAVQDPSLLSQMNSDVRILMGVSYGYSAAMYIQAQKIRTRLTTHFLRVLKKADFIVTPTTPCVAPIINKAALQGGESNIPETVRSMRFTLGPNFTGLPAISVPVGAGADSGMPVGLQLIGRPWSEAALLYAAAVVEAALAHKSKPPKILFDPLRRCIGKQ